MKSYYLDIEADSVLEPVYRLTANAAQQRGDALHVATEDNKDMLLQFLGEATIRLEGIFGRYWVGLKTIDDKSVFVYSMPDNWPQKVNEVNGLVESFLANYVTAKWIELWGTAEGFVNTANEVLGRIVELLNLRSKPI